MPVKKKPARKTAAKKRKPAKKATAKRKPARKTAAKKKPVRKATAKKKPARKATAKKKPARKAAPAKKKAAVKKAKPKTKRKPNAAFMKPMMPSSALSEVIGAKPMPRTEVTKKLWAYIKKNGLQDAAKRTMINADDKLKVVFGGRKQVSMFEMTKLVSKHLKAA